jgi:hypothetical protein
MADETPRIVATPTTLPLVRAYLGLEPSQVEEDGFLGILVNEANAWILGELGRDIAENDYVETRNGNGTPILLLEQYPVSAVTSVTLDGEEIPERVDTGDGGWVLIDAPPGVLALDGGYWTKGIQNVVIEYTAGYDPIPPDIQGAATEYAAQRYRARDRVGLMSRSVGGESVSYQTLTLPASISSVVERYRRRSA